MGELTTKAMKLATRAGGVASETAIVVDTYALSVSTRMFLESCRSGNKGQHALSVSAWEHRWHVGSMIDRIADGAQRGGKHGGIIHAVPWSLI